MRQTGASKMALWVKKVLAPKPSNLCLDVQGRRKERISTGCSLTSTCSVCYPAHTHPYTHSNSKITFYKDVPNYLSRCLLSTSLPLR